MNPPMIVEAIFGVTVIAGVGCAWLARPRAKPSAFERREAENRAMRAAAAWRAARLARRESETARKAFVEARNQQIALEMKSRARPQGWGR
jgi:hypothetical protein